MGIERTLFGRLDGVDVGWWTLSARDGMRAQIAEYGATLTSLWVPDANGNLADVVLGHDTLEEYRASPTYFGATAGRYGNRIRRGTFALDGRDHHVGINEGANSLHGGRVGFDKKLFTAMPDVEGNAVTFRLVSPDGDEGFPGRLDLSVRFALSPGRFEIEMAATTDRVTVCNPVHHSYWNLGGHDSGDVLAQQMAIHADYYTPCDAELLPTGEVLSVAGTPFDFRQPKRIGRDIADVANAGAGRSDDGGAGYDHNWCLRGFDGSMRPVVEADDPRSGRRMVLSTDQAGVHMYPGGYLGPQIVGKGGHRYARHAGFTLETQTWPDAPNLTHFPSATLRPGQTYRHRMLFEFTASAAGAAG